MLPWDYTDPILQPKMCPWGSLDSHLTMLVSLYY